MVRPTPRWLAAGLLFTAAAHAADHIDAPFTDAVSYTHLTLPTKA